MPPLIIFYGWRQIKQQQSNSVEIEASLAPARAEVGAGLTNNTSTMILFSSSVHPSYIRFAEVWAITILA
jgi:hypothetical protein